MQGILPLFSGMESLRPAQQGLVSRIRPGELHEKSGLPNWADPIQPIVFYRLSEEQDPSVCGSWSTKSRISS